MLSLLSLLFLSLPTQDINIAKLNLPNIFVITPTLFVTYEELDNRILCESTSSALFHAFKNDFGNTLDGEEYVWDEPEWEHYHRQDKDIYVMHNRDENGFYCVGVLCIVNNTEYFHWVKSNIILSKSSEERMFREIRWAMFRLFSMSKEELFSELPEFDPYPVDKEPEFMLK